MMIYFLHPVIGWYITYWFQLIEIMDNQIIQLMFPLIVVCASIFVALVLQMVIASVKKDRGEKQRSSSEIKGI